MKVPTARRTTEASAEAANREGFEKNAQLHSGKGLAKSQEDTEYKDRHTHGTQGTDNEARWRNKRRDAQDIPVKPLSSHTLAGQASLRPTLCPRQPLHALSNLRANAFGISLGHSLPSHLFSRTNVSSKGAYLLQLYHECDKMG